MMTSPLRVSPRRSMPGKTSEVMVNALYEASKTLLSSGAPAPLQATLDVLSNSLELRSASLALFRDDGLIDVSISSRGPQSNSRVMIALARETARRVRATQMPLVIESVWIELADHAEVVSSWRDTDLEESVVSVPVKGDGKVVGALAIVREHSAGDQANFYFDRDITLLGSISNLVGLALHVNRLAGGDVASVERATQPPPPTSTGDAATGVAGMSALWCATLRKAQTAARTNATVLLSGETGSGKNVIARAVHEASHRRDQPLVVLNCAALSETLLESELFGHEKGAFTGAFTQRKGRFELGDGGTLFLDEIGELSATFQAKLLRVLQLGEFERVGGTTSLKVDVRIIAATHRDLEAAVRSGTFRADLYYRLCVVPIRVPSLRERAEDIPVLARGFLNRFNAENGTALALGATAIAALAAFPFPGNVRELENAVRRAASLANHRTLVDDDFSFLEIPSGKTTVPREPSQAESLHPDAIQFDDCEHTSRLIDRDQLVDALERTGWVLAKAARILGLTPRQVSYAVQKHRISVRKY